MAERKGAGLPHAELAGMLATRSSRPLPQSIGKEPCALLCIDVQNPKYATRTSDTTQNDEEGLGGLLVPLSSISTEPSCRTGSVCSPWPVATGVRSSMPGRASDAGRARQLEPVRPLGIQSPADALDAQILPAVAPRGDEMVLEKVTSNAFESTNLDPILRNLGVRNVIVYGLVTNGCIDRR